MKGKGFLVVLTAPSGAGKTTIRDAILKKHPDFCYSISATTRKPRGNERNGRDYFFVSERKFGNMIDRGELIEWQKVHSNFYGTPKKYLNDMMLKGKIILLDIDIKGGINIKKMFPSAVFVFILPPSFKVLRKRLRERATDDEKTIALRLKNAEKEIKLIKYYDYLVINDEIKNAVSCVETLIRSEQMKIKRHERFIKGYLK